MLYLIFLFSLLFFFLAWRRSDWAVMLLIAALPAYLIRFSILGLPATLLEAMIWIVFIVWLLKNYKYIIKNLKFKIGHSLKIYNRYPFDWEIVLMLLIALAAVGAAGWSNSSFGIWKAYFFEPALLFVVLLNVMKGDKGREKILWALSVSALAVSLLAIYQKITGQLIDNPLWAAAGTRRVVSFFGYPNAVGLYLGPLALVMMGWLGDTVKNFQFSIFNYKIFKFFFIFSVIIVSVLSIYFTKSKGALLGVAAGLIIFGLLAGRKIRWTVIAVIIIIAVGGAAYQPVRHEAFKYLTLNDFSGQLRRAQWRETIAMLKDGRLLTGAGLTNYQGMIAGYHAPGIFIKDFDDPLAQRKLVFNPAYRAAHWQPLEIYLYPHNIILNFWSELGLAGLLLFIWIIGKYFCMGMSRLVIATVACPVPRHGEPQSRNVASAENWIAGQARNDRKEWKFLSIGLVGAMVVIVVHGLVDAPYFKNDLSVMFWLLVALMSLINLENKKSSLP